MLITDKGFYSEANILALVKERKEGLHLLYIIPLKRNSSLIDYSKIGQGNRKAFDGYFLFEKRAIWHYKYVLEDGDLKGKKVIVFLDERLRAEVEKDYLSRLEKNDTATRDNFFED